MGIKKSKVSSNSTEDDDLICPITLELFRDPVIAGDGHTYERDAITKWIREHGTSPLTRQPLRVDDLRPDDVRKRLVNQRRNSTVSFHGESNNVTLPPLRIPGAQVVSEADIITLQTPDRSSVIRVLKYILGVLFVSGYVALPIVSYYVFTRE